MPLYNIRSLCITVTANVSKLARGKSLWGKAKSDRRPKMCTMIKTIMDSISLSQNFDLNFLVNNKNSNGKRRGVHLDELN